MSQSNIRGIWSGGDLTFEVKADGTDLLTIADDGTITIPGTLVVGTAPDYTTSNVAEDREFDANSTSTEELADVLGTLIADLISIGLLQ